MNLPALGQYDNAATACDWCGAALRRRASLARVQGAQAEVLCGRCFGAYRSAVAAARAAARKPGGPKNG